MKRVSCAGLIWTVGFVLPLAVAAAPGEAVACGSAVYMAEVRAREPEVAKPAEVKPQVVSPKPVEIAPPTPPARKPALIVPPFPAPKPKIRRPPPPPPDKPLLVADAEQALSEGRIERAANLVAAAFPGLRSATPGRITLADRALRVLALATVRTEGRLPLGGMKVKTAGDRSANLQWAADMLGNLSARRGSDPRFQTDLGEALARLPARRAEAARILGELADRDLVTSAEGYAALARLRDAAARAALVKRCEVMTKTPAICAIPDAPAPSDRS